MMMDAAIRSNTVWMILLSGCVAKISLKKTAVMWNTTGSRIFRLCEDNMNCRMNSRKVKKRIMLY